MAIPITIEKLLEDNVVEWARIEFKENWNPNASLKIISAFANDIDNWGGGYIIIGIKEEKGKIARPIKGLSDYEIDHIQKDILKYCKYLRPSYIPISDPVKYEGANLLLLWCPGGYDRPYQCPKKPTSNNKEKIYYIRKLSSTIEATDLDVKELVSLTHNRPFDDRINMNSSLSDLNYNLIIKYLHEINSYLLNNIDFKSVKDLAMDLRIADGPSEYFKPLNVGLLFFNRHPEKFFPYAQIEVINIPDPTGQGMEEKIFKGPIDDQLSSALSYINSFIITEKIFKVDDQAESIRIKNYSYIAIEEFLSNAIYHKSYQINEPITVRIEKEQIEITSIPGPDRSISDDDIKNLKMRTRRYRNRRIGDFLKELHLVEGRNTGIPTALKAIKANGSPLPQFLTDEQRSFFSVIIPIHPAFIEKNSKKSQSKRKTKSEIKGLILNQLESSDYSTSSLYRTLGYSGNVSKTFKSCIDDLVKEDKVEYLGKKKNSPHNLLRKKDKSN